MLSFPAQSVAELRAIGRGQAWTGKGHWPLGDIVISVATANRQRVEYGLSEAEELERLFIHGLVHLLGYDHELSEAEDRRMRRVERYLLS